MKDPQFIETVQEGATYKVPTYKCITGEGMVDGDGLEIKFAKGNKADESAFRQEGMFTETMMALVIQHLKSVNVGDLSSRETSIAITKMEEALFWQGKRAADRQKRGVQGTYEK